MPAGLEASAQVSLPHPEASEATQFDFELFLVQATREVELGAEVLTKGATLGIFIRSDASERKPVSREGLGPGELRGVLAAGSGREVLVVARNIPDPVLSVVAETVLAGPAGDDPEIAGTEPVAHQVLANVPGIGSLPISPKAPGFVASFVSTLEDEAAAGFQRSVGVGVHRGKQSDLDVLAWWYGNYSQRKVGGVPALEFTREAHGQVEIGADSLTPIPLATITAWHEDGLVIIVWTVSLAEEVAGTGSL